MSLFPCLSTEAGEIPGHVLNQASAQHDIGDLDAPADAEDGFPLQEKAAHQRHLQAVARVVDIGRLRFADGAIGRGGHVAAAGKQDRRVVRGWRGPILRECRDSLDTTLSEPCGVPAGELGARGY